MSVPWIPDNFQPVAPDDAIDPNGMQDAQKMAEKLQPKAGPRYTKLQGLYGTVGMLLMPFDATCGMGILQNAEQTARAVDRLCRENSTIAKIVDRMLTGSAVMELIAAHAPLFLVIMQHHMPNGISLPWMTPEPSDDGQYAPD